MAHRNVCEIVTAQELREYAIEGAIDDLTSGKSIRKIVFDILNVGQMFGADDVYRETPELSPGGQAMAKTQDELKKNSRTMFLNALLYGNVAKIAGDIVIFAAYYGRDFEKNKENYYEAQL